MARWSSAVRWRGTAFDVALASPDRVSGLVVIGTGAPGFDVDDYLPPQWPDVLKAYGGWADGSRGRGVGRGDLGDGVRAESGRVDPGVWDLVVVDFRDSPQRGITVTELLIPLADPVRNDGTGDHCTDLGHGRRG